ncbi:MAG: alpha/beta hydrolase, partial [Oscillospiraceae bacterium]|nr:alpha/beta hydrolase [Oscillospiraceae bacterium]
MDIRIKIFCKLCDRLAKKLGAGLEMPKNVEYVTGLRYGGSADNYLHVAYPKGADSPLPTIINFHGGGYVYGSPEKYRFYCAFLAQQGFTVINFNYRLAPKHAFPSPLEDMNAVMEWAVRNKDEYHI